MSESYFIQLVGAVALVGISFVALGGAIVAAAPLEILLAAIGLFFDALGFAATERGYRDAQYQAAINIGARRRLEMILEEKYKKQLASRPTQFNRVPR